MVRAATTFIVFLLLASVLAGGPVYGGMTEKGSLLADLSASPNLAQARVRANPTEASELALDLIAYRWASKSTKGMPTDVRNIDQVISALAASVNDPVVNWAAGALSTPGESTSFAALPGSDPRVAQLTELGRQFGMALEFRDSSPLRSVTALTAVLDLCQKLHIDLSEALVRTLLGTQYHHDMARYRQAEDCYGRAAETYRAYGCSEARAMLLDDYGALCMDMDRYTAATQNYISAARLWMDLAKQNTTVSRYREMAGREYIRAGQAQGKAGDPEKALQSMSEGIAQLQASADMTKSFANLIRNLITVSDIYRDQGNLPRATDMLRRADTASKYNSDPLLNAQIHERLSIAYRATNLILKARTELDKRDKILQDAARAGQTALATVTTSDAQANRAALLSTAERGAGALQELKRYPEAAALLQGVGHAYERNAMTDQQIRCLRSLATVMDLQHMPQESHARRMEAAALAIKANRTSVAATIVIEIVQGFKEVGDVNSAVDMLQDLDYIMEQSGNVRGRAGVLEGRGTMLASHGRYEDAMANFEAALSQYSNEVGDAWAAGAVAVKLAQALRATGKPGDACKVLESSLNEIESRYAEENVDPNRDSERSGRMMEMYRELASDYVRDGRKDSATDLLMRARSHQWVSELVTQLRASEEPNIAEFAKAVDLLGGSGSSIPSVPIKPTLIANDWAQFSAKCLALREQHAARYNALPVKPLEEIYKSRNDLPRKALIIEFLPTENTTFAFVCGNGRSSIWELGVPAKEIDALVASLRKCVKECEQSLGAGIPLPRINDWREPTFLQFRDPMVSLYTKLVAPIAGEFTSYQMLVFALPKELDGVPMHALITSETDGTPRFLVQDYAVSYLGGGMLGDMIGKDSRPIDPSSDRLAIFADPAGDLPGAREEAKMLEKLYYESFIYSGKRATVNDFRKECNKASILHIAVHYKADPDPSKFVLQLAPDGDSNGEITLQELTAIANTHLQLVALSACESAASADPLQSGTSYAAEAFSLAGAKSVLGGLWKVSDASATELMGDFYRSLAKGKPRTESLQRAQVEMINAKEHAHPFYWACFALYGNPW